MTQCVEAPGTAPRRCMLKPCATPTRSASCCLHFNSDQDAIAQQIDVCTHMHHHTQTPTCPQLPPHELEGVAVQGDGAQAGHVAQHRGQAAQAVVGEVQQHQLQPTQRIRHLLQHQVGVRHTFCVAGVCLEGKAKMQSCRGVRRKPAGTSQHSHTNTHAPTHTRTSSRLFRRSRVLSDASMPSEAGRLLILLNPSRSSFRAAAAPRSGSWLSWLLRASSCERAGSLASSAGSTCKRSRVDVGT